MIAENTTVTPKSRLELVRNCFEIPRFGGLGFYNLGRGGGVVWTFQMCPGVLNIRANPFNLCK